MMQATAGERIGGQNEPSKCHIDEVGLALHTEAHACLCLTEQTGEGWLTSCSFMLPTLCASWSARWGDE